MNREPEYLDFEVQVGPNSSHDLEVQVLISPRDRPRAPFIEPCTPEKALDLLRSLEAMIKSDIRKTSTAEVESPDLQKLGATFFEALLPSDLRATLDASLAGRGQSGLRLRIAFDPRDDDLVSIAALPWEILFHSRQQRFLARGEDIALVRYLDVPVDIQRLFVTPPLRVLLVAPAPTDSKPSNVLEEQEAVYEVLRRLPKIEVERVKPPTLDQLIDKLRERPTHVVHFMGHGGLDREGGRSGVFFENSDRTKQCISGATLAERLESFFPSLKLVVLNSCFGAAGRRKPEQEPFGGVAAALISSGLTAVVGMQFLVSNTAAKRFAEAFYGKLVETGHVEVSAVHARREMVPEGSDSPEWITPVVLTRAANGRLFDSSPPPSLDEPLRLGIRSIFGWGVALESWSHEYLPLTSFFRGRYLNEEVRWQEDVYPHLAKFLRKVVAGRQSVHFDFAAHQSIAFAAGYLMDVRAGIQMTVRQRTAGETVDWRLTDTPTSDDWQWEISEYERDPDQVDLALAISPTRSTRTSVESYVDEQKLGIARIIELKPPSGPSSLSVNHGRHAFRLAEAISNKIYELTPGDWPGTIHLFYAGPNGLLFFLGRLSHGPRRIQLYEYDMDGQGNRTYMPSLMFPPPEVPES